MQKLFQEVATTECAECSQFTAALGHIYLPMFAF